MATLHTGELLFHSVVGGVFLCKEGSVVSVRQRFASRDPPELTLLRAKVLSSMMNLNEQLRVAARGSSNELLS
jgi:hypothetical protein